MTKQKLLLIGAVGVLVLILASIFPRLLICLHELLNVFASGRSPIRIYLFFGYVFLLLSLIQRYVFVEKIEKFFNTKLSRITLYFLIITFVFNFFHFAYFAHSHNLPLNTYLIAGSGEEITSSRLVHNHMGKIVIAPLVALFSDLVENADPGLGIYHFVSVYIALFYGVLVCICFVLVVLLFTSRVVEEKKPILYTVLYAILSFTLIKSLIDGGLFTETAFFALISFVFLIKKERNWYWFWLMVIGAFLVQFIFYFFGFYTDLNEFNTHSFKSFVFITLIVSLLYYYLQKSLNRLSVLLFILSLIAVISVVLVGILNTFMYRAVSFGNGQAIVGLYSLPKKIKGTNEFNVGNLKFYRIESTGKVGDVLDSENLLDNFNPVSVEWKTCFPKSQQQKISFVVDSKDQLLRDSFFDKMFVFKITKTTIPFRYEAVAVIEPCVPRSLNVVDELLKQAGLHTYILSKIKFTNE